MRALLITDCTTPLSLLEEASDAGLDALLLRDKTAPTPTLLRYALALRALSPLLLINERLDIALAARADGVHYPERCALIKHPSLLTGKSVHCLASALQAQQDGASYVLFGSLFSHKPRPQGLDALRALTSALRIPILAVGGITPANVASVATAGASGAAAISAFLTPAIASTVAAFQAPFTTTYSLRGLLAIVSNPAHAEAALLGGADMIQWRLKESYTPAHLDAARKARALCRSANIPFVVNDRVDIALHLDASGVHLGEKDLPLSTARRLLGPHKLLGATASTLAEALAAQAQGASYIGLGHIFPTSSKEKSTPPLGLSAIAPIASALHIPVFAIGGINAETLKEVLQEGAAGAAVLSAITNAPDPVAATRTLKEILLGALACRRLAKERGCALCKRDRPRQRTSRLGNLV